mgnify:CR=1 FL=1
MEEVKDYFNGSKIVEEEKKEEIKNKIEKKDEGEKEKVGEIETKKQETTKEKVVAGKKRKQEVTTNFMPKNKKMKTGENEELKIESSEADGKVREKRIPPVTKKRKNISDFDSLYYPDKFPVEIWRDEEKSHKSMPEILDGSVQTCNRNVIRAV